MVCKGCGQGLPVSGQKPYYEEVSSETVQNHQSIFVDSQFAIGIQCSQRWTIPLEGHEVDVEFPQVVNVPVGAYLYHPLYGYFKISKWNPDTHVCGLTNEAITGTAAPGTTVAAGTLFVATARPCCADDTSTLFPFVKEDFTPPLENFSTTIKVTSSFGLRAGEPVRIAEGVYRLTKIVSSLLLEIKNEGIGASQPVIAKDSEGNYQHLVVIENASGCYSSEPSSEGRILVCDGLNQRLLSGVEYGQVPVLDDPGNNVTKFQHLDAQVRLCSALTAGVDIEPGTTSYNVPVTDANEFVIGDLINQITSALPFQVTGIVGNTLQVSYVGAINIPAPETWTIGTSVCRMLTTDQIWRELASLALVQAGDTSNVLSLLAGYLLINGTRAMTGNLDMGTHSLVNLGPIQANIDMNNKTLVNLGALAAALQMGNNKITGLANGTVNTDAATFGQVKDGSNITDGTIVTAKIADSAITSAKIGNSQVTNAKISDGAITTAKLDVGAVTTEKLAAGAVDVNRIADGQVSLAKLAYGSVDENRIVSDAVTTGKIKDGNVTLAKLAPYLVPGPIQWDASVLQALGGGSAIIASNFYSHWSKFGSLIFIHGNWGIVVTGNVYLIEIALPSTVGWTGSISAYRDAGGGIVMNDVIANVDYASQRLTLRKPSGQSFAANSVYIVTGVYEGN